MKYEGLPLVGNESLTLPSSLSHGYIIAGEEGSGRGLLLRYLCQLAQCQAPSAPCGVCSHCGKIARGSHIDVIATGTETPPNVATVRELRQSVFTTPNEGKRKIYIIHHADRMNQQGQNALLKILEEPPSYGLFFLVTKEGGGVLETLRSRCQQITLYPVSPTVGLDYLAQRFPDAPQREEAFAESGGYLGRAIEALTPPPPVEEEDTGLKKVKTRRSSVKEVAPPPPSPPSLKVQEIARGIVRPLFAREELALLEACRNIETLDRGQRTDVMNEVTALLTKELGRCPQAEIYQWITVVQRLSKASESYIKGEQLACWLCAGLSDTESKGG